MSVERTYFTIALVLPISSTMSAVV